MLPSVEVIHTLDERLYRQLSLSSLCASAHRLPTSKCYVLYCPYGNHLNENFIIGWEIHLATAHVLVILRNTDATSAKRAQIVHG